MEKNKSKLRPEVKQEAILDQQIADICHYVISLLYFYFCNRLAAGIA